MSSKHNIHTSNETLYQILRVLIHIVGFAQFSYSVYYDLMYVVIPPQFSNPFAGKFKFLTFWDTILQALYFGICIINDIIGSNEINPRSKPFIRSLKDMLLSSVGFPVAMFVGVTFWGLMAIDRELVFPKLMDTVFPSWLNHMVHTNIMIFTTLEVVTSFRVYPSRSKGLAALVSFMGVYLIWVHIIYAVSGHWVYPVMNVLNAWQRAVFFAVSLLFGCLLYLVGETLNNRVWHRELQQLQKSGGKQTHKKNK